VAKFAQSSGAIFKQKIKQSAVEDDTKTIGVNFHFFKLTSFLVCKLFD